MFATLLGSPRIVLLLLSLAKAYHYIDDSDSAITYAGEWYNNVTAYSYDFTQVHDRTGHYGYPGSTAEIPFTGSGITLYIFCDRGGCGLNASIDGDTLTAHMGLTTPGVIAYNVSMYDVQGLYSDRPHNLHIEPWGISTNFDYAIVNDTVFPPSPTTISQTSPISGPSGGSKKKVVGSAVGGVIGGVVVIAGVAFLILSLRRRQSARDSAEIDPDPKSSAYDDIPTIPIATIPTLVHSALPHTEARHSMEPTSSMRSSQPDMTNQTIAVPLVEPHTTRPTNTRLPQPNVTSNELSDEQADFVHDLYDLNVPAPAIASVITRMVRRREGSGGGSGAGVAPGTT